MSAHSKTPYTTLVWVPSGKGVVTGRRGQQLAFGHALSCHTCGQQVVQRVYAYT